MLKKLENGRTLFNICPNAIRYSLQFSLRFQILRPRSIIFLLCLLFDLGYRGLLFASTMNLEAEPALPEFGRYGFIVRQINKLVDKINWNSCNLLKSVPKKLCFLLLNFSLTENNNMVTINFIQTKLNYKHFIEF